MPKANSYFLPSWLRAVSATMAVTFLWTNVLFAQRANPSFWEERQLKVRSQKSGVRSQNNGKDYELLARLPAIQTQLPFVANPSQRIILSPGEESSRYRNHNVITPLLSSIAPYAEIKEIYSPSLASSPKSQATAVIIQDVHQHYEAQKNIASIIQNIASNMVYHVVVGLEGAVGPFDFSPYRAYSDKKLTADIAGFFMKQGMIGGPEFYGITAPDNQTVPMVGVEDEKLYLANIKAFKDSLPLERQVKIEVEKRQVELRRKKGKVFNPTLLELDKKRETYHEGNLSLGEYLTALVNAYTNTVSRLPSTVSHLVEAYHIEKYLNIPKLESERSQILDTLADKLLKSSLNELLNSALAYRTSAITYAQFYSYFKEAAKRAGIALSQFPEMDKHVRYVQLADSIDKNKLFTEIEQLETNVENSLAKTKEEKELLKESKYLELAKKLVEFSLTPEEWKQYKSLSTITTPDESGNYNDTTNAITPAQLKSFEQFYETALKRNETLLSNLLKTVNYNNEAITLKHNNAVAVLVTGGFHTNGITHILKDKNIPYIVLAPNITKVEEGQTTDLGTRGQTSLELLARTKTPLEKLFTGEKIFLQSQRLTSNTPSPEFTLQAKTFRETYGLLEVAGAQNLEEAQKAAKHTKKLFNLDITDIKFQTHALFSAAWLKAKILPNKIATLIVTWMDSSKKSVAENISSYEEVIDDSTQLLYGEIGGRSMRMGAVKESGLQQAFIAIKSTIQHGLKTLKFFTTLIYNGKKLTTEPDNSTSTLGLIGLWKRLGITSWLEKQQQKGRTWTVAGLVGVLALLEEVIFSWGLLQHILPGFLSWAFAVLGFPDTISLAVLNLHFNVPFLNSGLSFLITNLIFGLAHTRLIKWQNGKLADTGKAKWQHRLLFFPLLGAAFRINYVFSDFVPVNPFLLALILHTFHNDVLTRFLSKLVASFKLPAWLSPPLMHIAVPKLNLNGSKYLPKSWVEQNVPALKDKNIVEVTMEMALSNSILKMLESKLNKDDMRAVAMATTVGGIGPLLKERIISQSRYGANVIGISLLYDNVWVQKVSDGTLNLEKVEIGKYLRGIKDPVTGKYHGGVLEYVDDIDIEMYDDNIGIVQVKAWKAPAGAYGGGTVYFLDMPDIADSIWARANVVYPGHKDISEKEDARFRQSWLLGRGTLEFMKKLNKTADVVVMSEAPTMFVHHRVFRDKFSNDPFFENTVYIFNDHTPMDYAHPEWDLVTLKKLKVDPIYYDNMPFWNKDGKADATALIINTADGAYGVARKHGMVMRMMPLLRQFAEKIQWITNGVSEAYWPHDELKSAYKVARMSDAALLAIKDRRREKLIRWLAERQGLGQDWANKVITEGNPIGVWTRRIVDYKRLERLMDILENDKMKEQFLDSGIILVIGGRIHQDDSYGLNQFNRLQSAIHKDPRLHERVIFFENYNIWEAPNLFQGTDLSIMLADDGREAAATGFMKGQMSGALIIASEDGAVPESVVFYDGTNADVANGFNVPFLSNGEPSVDGLLKAFTDFGKVFKDKKSLARMVRNAIQQTPRVSVNRTAQDMLIFFGNVVTKTAKNKEYLNNGKRIADKIFASLHNGSYKSNRFQLNEKETEIVSSYLEHGINKFLWGYKEWGYHVKPIDLGGPGFNGFAQSVKYILSLGTVGEWSLAFHAHNQNGRGDIITYIEYALNKMLIDLKHTQSESLVYEYLVSAINKIEKLGNQAQKTFGTKGKVMLNLKTLGLYSGVVQILSDSTDANKAIIEQGQVSPPPSLPLGYTWWVNDLLDWVGVKSAFVKAGLAGLVESGLIMWAMPPLLTVVGQLAGFALNPFIINTGQILAFPALHAFGPLRIWEIKKDENLNLGEIRPRSPPEKLAAFAYLSLLGYLLHFVLPQVVASILSHYLMNSITAIASHILFNVAITLVIALIAHRFNIPVPIPLGMVGPSGSRSESGLEILKFALDRYEESVKPDLDLLKQQLLRLAKYQEGFNQESIIRQIIENINAIKQKYETEIHPPLLQLTRDPRIPKDLKNIVEDTLSDFGNGLQHFTSLTIMSQEKAVKYLATPGKLNTRMEGIAHIEAAMRKMEQYLQSINPPAAISGTPKPKSAFLTLITMGAWIFGLWILGNHGDLQLGLVFPFILMLSRVEKTMPQKNDRRANLSGKIKYSDDIESEDEKSKIQYLLENLEHFPESGLQIQRIDVRKEYDRNYCRIYEINFISTAEEILAPPVALKIYEPFIELVKTLKKYAKNSENTANKLAKKNKDIAPKEVRAIVDFDPSTGKPLIALRKEYIAGNSVEDTIWGTASTEERHRLAVKGLATYLAMYKALGYLIEDADPENVVIEDKTGQAKIIDFETPFYMPAKKLKEPIVLNLLRENWELIITREDEFLEAFVEAARQVYGQEADRFLEKAGVFPYFMERLQKHLYELKPHLTILKYLMTIFDGTDEARERYIFAMEENVANMLNIYRKIQSFLNKHVIPEQLKTTIEDNIGNVLFSFSLLPPLNRQKLKRFKHSLLEEIKWVKDIMETHTATIEKEYYEERALGEMLRIFPTLTPVPLEYISSEFTGITPERIKEMLGSAGFYTRTGKQKATGKTATYLKPENLGAAVRQVSHPDTERSEDESALRRTIREEMGKIMSETKVNLLSDFEPFELKEIISELPEEHRGSGNLWYMVRLADFFSAARSERQTRRFQSGHIYKKELSRVLFFMTGEELGELVKVAEDWHDSEQEMDNDSFAAFAEKLFRIQGSSFALAKGTGRRGAMDFEQMFSAFGRLAGFIAPEIQLGQELKEKLKPLWEYGTKLPGQLKKSRLLRTRNFIKKDKSWSGVRLFDVSNISEDTLTQMWTNIKMVKGKIAIGLMTDKAVLGKDDIENIKKSLRSRWNNMSDKNRPDFDEMLKSVHFGEIIVTAADLMKNEHVESPLVEINPDVLYKVTRDKAKNLFGNTEQIPVQLFTPNPFRFKLSWKEEALQILAIVTAIQILEIGNKTEDAIRQIKEKSTQA